jgi:two-component system cell cycle sensor histidine kinase/response regulator CckA
MFFFSLKTKMSIAVSLLMTAVLSLLSVSAFKYFEINLKKTISIEQFTMVSALAEEIDNKILNVQTVLDAVAARVTPFIADKPRRAQAFLDARSGTLTVFDSGIFIFSQSGKLVAVSPAEPRLQGRDYSFRDYIKKTIATGRPQISAPFSTTQTHHHPIIMFTSPFFDARGKLAGIMAGAVDLMRNNFLGKIATVRIGKKGYLFLYSTDRTMIVHPDRTRILRRDVPPGVNRLYDRAIGGFNGSGDTVNSRGLHAVSSFKHLRSTNWILGANFPQSEVYAPIYRARWYLLAALVLIPFISCIIVWGLMSVLTAPLRQFTGHVRGLAGRGGRLKPIRIKSGDEIETLGQAFNEMLEEMEKQKTAIREQKEFSENLLLNSAVPTFVLDSSHRVIIWNKACEELTGINAEKLLGTTDTWKAFYREKRPVLADIIIEQRFEYLQNNYSSYNKSPFTPDGLQAEGWCLAPNCGNRYVFFDAVPLRNAANEVTAVIQSVLDITERVRAREELEFKNIILSTQQENSIDAILLVDEKSRIISHNRRFKELWGIPSELVEAGDDAPVLRLVASRVADSNGFLERVKYLYEHTEEKSREEILLRDERVIDRYTAPILDADGKYFGRVWYMRDITERKRAEAALRESEQRYRGLVELFPDAIFIHTGGKLIFANTQGARLLGAEKPEDLYGREALDFVHPDNLDFVGQRINNAFRTGKPNPPTEEVFVRLDGTPVPVEVASVPLTYQGKTALQIIARDITDRRKMQEDLLKAQKLESLGVLAGGIAHDFNNILTGVLGNLSLANTRLEPSHPVTRYLRDCEKAAIRASKLTRQLLTFARGGEPVKKLIDAAPLIRETISFALRGSNVKAAVDIDDTLWNIEVDSGQISQVLHNILINAAQAMPGGGEATIRALNETLSAGNSHRLPPGQYVRIIIEDHGCGIAPENLDRIFDPYFTTKPEGSGLGLASAYSIVKHHSGAVEVSSTVGIGSCITILLPALPGGQPECEAETNVPELTGNGRILIMDDEDFIREIATEILQFAGYYVKSCADGREAVELFRDAWDRNSPFDAVILDLTVPGGMGGKETAARMLEIDPDALLIVSSGYSNDPVVANFERYGFSGVVSKPFDVVVLTRELDRLIRKT